jgi:hypothetical protein
MSKGFDKVYNDECARIWNPDPASPITFEVRQHGYNMGFYVVARREGLSIQQGSTFKVEADAIAVRDQLQEEHDND